MDEVILKWITALTGGLAAIVCITLLLLPGAHENGAHASESVQEETTVTEQEETRKHEKSEETEEAEELEETETANTAATAVSAPEDVVKTDNEISAQLKIELPEWVTQDSLVTENDYLTQTVYIRMPGTIRDYFSEYSVRGSCEHISALSYYCEDGESVIELSLDRVYELDESFEDGSLYLDFIDPHEIYDRVIVVDAGHGGRASGASKNDIEEKNVNLAIVTDVKELFDACPENIGVYYTRLDDANPTLDQRVQLANLSDADLFISVHCNSNTTNRFSARRGTEVLYSESDTSDLSSKSFAEICLDNVTEMLGSKSLGLVEGDRIYIVRTSEVPVALIEMGYITNRSELESLASEDYQKLAAQGIYNAVLEAFEEGY